MNLGWLVLNGQDTPTAIAAAHGYFQTPKLLDLYDPADLVELEARDGFCEHLIVSSRLMVLQSATHERRAFYDYKTSIDVLFLTHESPQTIKNVVRSSVPGFRAHWSYLQNQVDDPGDLDARIDFLRDVRDKRISILNH